MSKSVQTSHPALQKWVDEMTALCTPDSVEWCDGSQAEWDRLTSMMVEKGTFTRLNPEKRPNSFLARSTPSDVARVEAKRDVPHGRLTAPGIGNTELGYL